MALDDLVLLVHLAATWTMIGVIRFVRAVHVPHFAGVGAAGFAAYAAERVRRTRLVVGPPMPIEAATAALLVLRRPVSVPAALTWTGAGLLPLGWLSTALLQVPRRRGRW